jgi:hypothetical protein
VTEEPVSLREHLERIHADHVGAHRHEHESHAAAHEREHALNQQAINKAEASVDKAVHAARETMEKSLEALESKVTDLTDRLNRSEGKGQGIGAAWTVAVALIGIALTVVAFLVTR